jgi:DNA-directed RNA polymerase subunit H
LKGVYGEKMDFNILKHELVPYHEVLGPKEVKQVLKTYNITKEQLPRVVVTDPVARAIGAREGDVLKVIRKSRTAGISVAFRFVVSTER